MGGSLVSRLGSMDVPARSRGARGRRAAAAAAARPSGVVGATFADAPAAAASDGAMATRALIIGTGVGHGAGVGHGGGGLGHEGLVGSDAHI